MTATVDAFEHVFVPAESGGPDFTLLLLHGTGGNERDLVPLGRALAPGAALLSPRGKVNEGGQARFFRRLAEGVFDLEDLHRRTAELSAFLTASAIKYGFDPARVIAVGFSNGANIAGSLLLSRPEMLAGAVLLRPMTPFEPETTPDLSARQVLIAAGDADPLVTIEETERLVTLLQGAGATVELHWHQGGHGLGDDDVVAAQSWMQENFPSPR